MIRRFVDTVRACRMGKRIDRFFERRVICKPSTDIVIEGYPRWANTYTVDFINYLYRCRYGRNLNIAHHTHSYHNVVIGARLRKPVWY